MFSVSGIAAAQDDVTSLTMSLSGTLTSANEFRGHYGENYEIVETKTELDDFIGKEVSIEAVLVESAADNKSISVKSIEPVEYKSIEVIK
jgi:hypothetical protein